MKFLFLVAAFVGISGGTLPCFASTDKGIGPVKELKFDASLDTQMANKGSGLFTTKCSACHKIGERYVGPALKDITKRRAPEWIMNMILNPAEMIEKDETAKELYGEYLVPMTFQNVTTEEARMILEYFKGLDSGAIKNDAPKGKDKKK